MALDDRQTRAHTEIGEVSGGSPEVVYLRCLKCARLTNRYITDVNIRCVACGSGSFCYLTKRQYDILVSGGVGQALPNSNMLAFEQKCNCPRPGLNNADECRQAHCIKYGLNSASQVLCSCPCHWENVVPTISPASLPHNENLECNCWVPGLGNAASCVIKWQEANPSGIPHGSWCGCDCHAEIINGKRCLREMINCKGCGRTHREVHDEMGNPICTGTHGDPVWTKGYNRAKRNVSQDLVNHPRHYTSHPSGVECIEITEYYNFNVGNAVKYLWRAGLKNDDALEDLEKSLWYIKREIGRLNKLDTRKGEHE